MNRHTLRDIIQHKNKRKVLGVANIAKSRERELLKWYGHLKRWGISKKVRKIENCNSKKLLRGQRIPRMT